METLFTRLLFSVKVLPCSSRFVQLTFLAGKVGAFDSSH